MWCGWWVVVQTRRRRIIIIIVINSKPMTAVPNEQKPIENTIENQKNQAYIYESNHSSNPLPTHGVHGPDKGVLYTRLVRYVLHAKRANRPYREPPLIVLGHRHFATTTTVGDCDGDCDGCGCFEYEKDDAREGFVIHGTRPIVLHPIECRLPWHSGAPILGPIVVVVVPLVDLS